MDALREANNQLRGLVARSFGLAVATQTQLLSSQSEYEDEVRDYNDLDERNLKLQHALHQIQTNLNAVRAQTEDVRAKASSLERNIATHDQHISVALKALQAAEDSFRTQEARFLKVSTSLEKCKQETEVTEMKYAKIMQEFEQGTKALQVLQEEVQTRAASCAETNRNAELMEADIIRYANANVVLRQRLASLNIEVSSAKARLDSATEAVAKAKQDGEALRQSTMKMTEQKNELTNKLEQARLAATASVTEVMEASCRLREAEDVVRVLKHDLVRSQEEVSGHRKQVEQITRDHIATLKKEEVKLKQMNQQEVNEVLVYQGQLREVTEEAEGVEMSISTLRSTLQAEKMKKQQLLEQVTSAKTEVLNKKKTLQQLQDTQQKISQNESKTKTKKKNNTINNNTTTGEGEKAVVAAQEDDDENDAEDIVVVIPTPHRLRIRSQQPVAPAVANSVTKVASTSVALQNSNSGSKRKSLASSSSTFTSSSSPAASPSTSSASDASFVSIRTTRKRSSSHMSNDDKSSNVTPAAAGILAGIHAGGATQRPAAAATTTVTTTATSSSSSSSSSSAPTTSSQVVVTASRHHRRHRPSVSTTNRKTKMKSGAVTTDPEDGEESSSSITTTSGGGGGDHHSNDHGNNHNNSLPQKQQQQQQHMEADSSMPFASPAKQPRHILPHVVSSARSTVVRAYITKKTEPDDVNGGVVDVEAVTGNSGGSVVGGAVLYGKRNAIHRRQKQHLQSLQANAVVPVHAVADISTTTSTTTTTTAAAAKFTHPALSLTKTTMMKKDATTTSASTITPDSSSSSSSTSSHVVSNDDDDDEGSSTSSPTMTTIEAIVIVPVRGSSQQQQQHLYKNDQSPLLYRSTSYLSTTTFSSNNNNNNNLNISAKNTFSRNHHLLAPKTTKADVDRGKPQTKKMQLQQQVGEEEGSSSGSGEEADMGGLFGEYLI